MYDPTLLVIVILLTIAGIAGTVILLLMPAREKLLRDEPAENDARVSGLWAGGLDAPGHHALPAPQDNVIHHDFGGHAG